jgi:hypothetical protein
MDRDSDEQLAEGTIAVLDNQIAQTTGTLRIKGTFPNKDGALWPGQYLNIRLLARTEPNVVTVPSSALQRGPDGYYAYVVKPDSTVETRPLKVGQVSGGVAIVDDGRRSRGTGRDGRAIPTAARRSRYSKQHRRQGLIAGARPAERGSASRLRGLLCNRIAVSSRLLGLIRCWQGSPGISADQSGDSSEVSCGGTEGSNLASGSPVLENTDAEASACYSPGSARSPR